MPDRLLTYAEIADRADEEKTDLHPQWMEWGQVISSLRDVEVVTGSEDTFQIYESEDARDLRINGDDAHMFHTSDLDSFCHFVYAAKVGYLAALKAEAR